MRSITRPELHTLLRIFVFSFLLNFAWEELHARLYLHYKSGAITHGILLHATLMDAVFITLFAAFAILIPFMRKHIVLFAVLAGLIAAIGIEWWAQGTGRWAYGEAMPIVPLIGTGLTPTIQLALTGIAAFWLSGLIKTKKQGQ